jgi:drug/metabolite transporter (DMT)-like permease
MRLEHGLTDRMGEPAPESLAMVCAKGQPPSSAQMSASGHSNTTGILLFCLGMAGFATGDSILKYAMRTYALEQAMMIRLGMFVIIALAMAHWRGGITRAFRSGRPWLQLARSSVLVVDSIAFSVSLGVVGLSGTHAIYATIPLFVTALAVPLLGEKVGWRRWTAVAVGFAGSLLVIQPGAGVLDVISLLALAGAFASSFYSILTRLVSRTDAIETSFFYVALVGFLVMAPLGLWKWRTPDLEGLLLFAGMTLASLLGHLCVIRGLTLTEATVLQPFQYVLLAAATTYGVLLFGEHLEPLKVAGTLIVVASGLYVAWREYVLSRRVQASV